MRLACEVVPPCARRQGIFFLLSLAKTAHSARVKLSSAEIRRVVAAALREDVGSGDATTLATVPRGTKAEAQMNARENLVVCGLAFAEAAFMLLSRSVKIRRFHRDGNHVRAGQPLLHVEGPARALLTAERVALNFVQRLSGIATASAAYVNAVAGTGARILDTRKTTPGWRRFEKYAVQCGGAQNHRHGLYDRILIKDNHLAALKNTHPDPVAAAVARARRRFPALLVEVEADTLAQVDQALSAGADFILLDNMTPAQLRKAVKLVRGRVPLEASGGVHLKNVRAIARTGVDCISVGSITHSAGAVDVALDFFPAS